MTGKLARISGIVGRLKTYAILLPNTCLPSNMSSNWPTPLITLMDLYVHGK